MERPVLLMDILENKWNTKLHYMDCEAEAMITRIYYEFKTGLESSVNLEEYDLVDEKIPWKKKIAYP